MGTCSSCGNEYDQTFDVTTADGQTVTFDSIECTARKIAPTCAQCGVLVLGHGVKYGRAVFCCNHCARGHGIDTPDTA